MAARRAVLCGSVGPRSPPGVVVRALPERVLFARMVVGVTGPRHSGT